MTKNSIYRVTFFNHGKIYEIYAKHVSHEALYGFVEVGDLVFGKTASLVVDPSEERLKTEFSGVSKTFIPIHAILRIDAVDKSGVAKIRDQADKTENITQFPVPIYQPSPDSKK